MNDEAEKENKGRSYLKEGLKEGRKVLWGEESGSRKGN